MLVSLIISLSSLSALFRQAVQQLVSAVLQCADMLTTATEGLWQHSCYTIIILPYNRLLILCDSEILCILAQKWRFREFYLCMALHGGVAIPTVDIRIIFVRFQFYSHNCINY